MVKKQEKSFINIRKRNEYNNNIYSSSYNRAAITLPIIYTLYYVTNCYKRRQYIT